MTLVSRNGTAHAGYTWFIKPVFRYCREDRIFRLVRLVWRRGTPGDGNGYTAKLSLSLAAKLFRFSREILGGWTLVVFGLRLHHRRSYGGWIV